MTDRRRQAELSHGRSIAARAAAVWGQHGAAGQARVARRSAVLADAVRASTGRLILELGCGTGEYTERLAASGASLIALDLVPDLIQIAAARALPPTVSFVLGDAEALPFPDASFDGVVGNAVLHHLRLAPALREIRRVLRPGGRCAFTEPNMLNPQVALMKNVPPLKRLFGDTPHETAFIAPLIRRRFNELSLIVDRVEPFDWLHPAVPAPAVPLVRRLEARLERLPLLSHAAGSLTIVARRDA